MSVPLRFDQIDATRQQVIRKNLETLESKGASDDEVESYLRDDEGLAPAGPQQPNKPPASLVERARSFPAQSAFVAPGQKRRLEEQSHRPLLESVDLPFGAQRDLNAAAQGATFGFSDEAAAAFQALLGRKYGDAVKDERAGLSQFREEHPVRSFLDELAGGVVTTGPLAAGKPAATAGARVARAAATGAGTGALAGAGSAEGGLDARARGAVHGAKVGAVVGGAAGGVGEVARFLAKKSGKVTPGESADIKLGKSLERDNMTVDDAIDRAREFSDEKPAVVLDVGGKNTQRLGRAVHTQPSKGSGQLSEGLTARGHGAEERTINDLIEGVGLGGRQNAFKKAEDLVAERGAKAKPKYAAAYDGDAIDDEAVISALEVPAFQQAYRRGQRIAKLEGVDLPDVAAGPTKTHPVRDGQGRLRADLSKVSKDELDAEVRRLSDLNAKEKAYHASVKEAGYRHDYEELPRTEKFGRKGKEDLPDADGAVDPERLAADNKIVKDFNRSQIVRAAREKAIRRIEGEMKRRPAADDFNFGANADEGFDYYGDDVAEQVKAFAGLPVQGLDYMKRGLDDLIESKMARGAMGRTEARALRNKLKDVLERADEINPAYGEARAQFAGDSRLMDAYETGRAHFKTHPDESALSIDGMTAGERELYRKGAREALTDRIEGRAPNRDPGGIADKTMDRKRLRLLFDDADSFEEFQKRLGEEAQMHRTRTGIQGGSPTADKLAELSDMAGIPLDAIMQGATGSAGGMLRSVLRTEVARRLQARLQGLNEKQADALAERMLAGTRSRDDLLEMLERIKETQAGTAERATKRGSTAIVRANRIGAGVSNPVALAIPSVSADATATDDRSIPPEVLRFLRSRTP